MRAFEVEPAHEPLHGTARVPGDKSIGHRSAILGALCDGDVEVVGLSEGEDNRSTRRAMAAMGVEFEHRGEVLVVHGRGLHGLRAPAEPLDCGNAGTGMRLLCGLAAGQSFPVTLTGDESLTQRPMRRVAAPLEQMGAKVSGREVGGKLYPPLHVQGGALVGIDYQSPVASAQVKSAILLAAMYARGRTRVVEPGPSRDHSERMLRYLGVPVEEPALHTVTLDPDAWDGRLVARPIAVPADPSSAAFIVAAGLIAGARRVTLPGTCVNPTRTGFLDVLIAMGATIGREDIDESGCEPVATLVLERGAGDELRAGRVAGDVTVRAIDELPILSVVAAFADGDTDFADAAELRVKESDRIATTCAMLRAFGVEVSERDDGFTVRGVPGRTLRAARIDAAGDHRIAMAGAVAALRADGPSRIDDVDNVATSFPGFDRLMNELGAALRLV